MKGDERIRTAVPAPSDDSVYDRRTRQWVGRCPHGDDCTGCDARGYCTREEDDRAVLAPKYRTIVADPPWPIIRPTLGGPKRNVPPYPLMQVEQMKLLDVPKLCEDDAHLYLWTTHEFVCQARTLAEAWGFFPTYLLVWAKPGLGVGGRFRHTCEFIWFCDRGYDAHPITRSDLGTWFAWPRGEHSAKPDAFFDLVQSVSPGPYLELFARRQRLGWDTWGNEALEHVALQPTEVA